MQKDLTTLTLKKPFTTKPLYPFQCVASTKIRNILNKIEESRKQPRTFTTKPEKTPAFRSSNLS